MEKNQKGKLNNLIKILILIIVILLIIAGVTIYVVNNSETKEETNYSESNDFISDIEIKYLDYNFTEVKDVTDNLEKDYFKDSNPTSAELNYNSESCDSDASNYKIEINNGILTVYNKTNNTSYKFNNITNYKSIVTVAYQSCDNVNIYLLTEDGKLYYRKNFDSNSDYFEPQENDFKLVSTNGKVAEITPHSLNWNGRLYKLDNGDIYQLDFTYITSEKVSNNIKYSSYISGFTDNIYDGIMLYSNSDYTMTIDIGGENYIKDEEGNKVKVQYITDTKEVYIIDINKNLYELDTTTYVAKNLNKKVMYIGEYNDVEKADKNYDIILVLDDNTTINVKTDALYMSSLIKIGEN